MLRLILIGCVIIVAGCAIGLVANFYFVAPAPRNADAMEEPFTAPETNIASIGARAMCIRDPSQAAVDKSDGLTVSYCDAPALERLTLAPEEESADLYPAAQARAE